MRNSLTGRLITLLVVVMVGSSVMGGSAQDNGSAEVVYSVAFGLVDGRLNVASLLSDGSWQVGQSEGRALFGEVDTQFVQPRWTADGRYVYMTIYEPGSNSIATRIQRYDVAAQTSEIVLDTFPPRQRGDATALVGLNALSPDGQYAWVSRLRTGEQQLFDLQNGRVLSTGQLCPAQVLEWQADSVLMACTGLGFAPPDIFTLSLADGARGSTLLPPPLDEANPLSSHITAVEPLAEDRLLVGTFTTQADAVPRYVGVIARDAYDGQYFGPGRAVRPRPDGQQIAYISAGRVQRADLASNTTTDLGTALLEGGTAWQDDALRFWRPDTTPDGDFRLVRVEAQPLRRVETVYYVGVAPERYTFAPNAADVFALEFRPSATEAFVELYRDGELIWVSDFAFPGSYTTLQNPQAEALYWSPDGEWLHMDFRPDLQTPVQTLSVNVQTATVRQAPEARTQLVSQSPDGAWWLYTPAFPDALDQPASVIAHNPATNQTVQISEFVAPYTTPFFPTNANYIWSSAADSE